MAFFNLLARLGVDTSSYELGLKRAENSATSFGTRLERKLGQKLDNIFGAGALIAGITGIIHSFRELQKESVEIDRLAHKFNLATAEVYAFQRMAKATGASLDELAKKGGQPALTTDDLLRTTRKQIADRINLGGDLSLTEKVGTGLAVLYSFLRQEGQASERTAAGGWKIGKPRGFMEHLRWLAERARNRDRYDYPSEEDEIDRLIKEQKPHLDKLAEARRNLYLESLDPAEKLLALEKELKVLQQEPSAEATIANAQRLTKAAQLELEIARLSKAKTIGARPFFPQFESMDALARIGGFTGTAQYQLLSLQERTARATEETASNTKEQP